VILPVPFPSPTREIVTVLLAALMMSAPTLTAQRPGPAAPAAARGLDPAILDALRFRNIGPAVTGGRIVEFAVPEDDADTIYVATASGGAWKTTNGGTTWTPIFDHARTVSIGAITVARANPHVVWIGTGEANSVRSSSWGDGVYKSTDGGQSWTHMGLETSQHVGRIVIHPTDTDTVYVAALGALWGANEERGLYKTTDGGKTWTRSLEISRHTGVVDVAMDPRDPNVLYAAAFQRERRYYSFLGGGPEGGLHKSVDGGRTWTKLSHGLPREHVGRVGIAVCPSRPDRLYAAIVGPDGGIFRSEDRGESWERRTDRLSTHWYYGQIYCDPANPERVYVPMTPFHVSDDGGRTFRSDFARPNVHADHHTFWVNPKNPRHMLLGNDGGIYISRDAGTTWDFQDHLSITQFYTVAVDMQEPFYYVYGGTQDNSSYGGPSGTRNTDGIVNGDWYMTVPGDGFFAQIDPTDASIVYTESQYGNMSRFDTRTGERKFIQPQPPEGQKYRWNWSAPILISAHDPKIVYVGANLLFKSTNRGDAWRALGGDLTRQVDEYTLPMQGVVQPRTAIDLHASTADYGNITSIAESPLRAGVLAVGTDDGLIQLTRDDGANWTRIDRIAGIPEQARVSRVVLSRAAESTLYATFDAHQDNDFRPYVVRSTDFGRTWASLSSTLPDHGSVHVIAEHPRNLNLLFVGTEFGLFVTIDGGATWQPFRSNLPTVAVHDIVIHPRDNDLVLGTHGRGFWILDDLSGLEGLTAARLSSGSPELFPVRRGWQLNRFNRGRNSLGQQRFVAPNPPDGAIVNYFARQGERVDVDVHDGQGRLVRRLAVGTAAPSAGLHRLVWDLREAPPIEFAGPDDPDGFRPRVRGPFVLPGQYEVRLTAGSTRRTQTVQVLGDPLIPISDADRQTRLDTLRTLGTALRTVTGAQTTLDRFENELRSLRDAIARHAGAPAALGGAHASAVKEVAALQLILRGEPPLGIALTPGPPGLVELIRMLYTSIDAATSLPTADQTQQTTRGLARLQEVVARTNALTATTMPALYGQLDAAGVPWTPGRLLPRPQ